MASPLATVRISEQQINNNSTTLPLKRKERFICEKRGRVAGKYTLLSNYYYITKFSQEVWMK